MHSRPIQVLEVGGRGGVYQHSLATCIALVEAGHDVTLHTASDPEFVDKRVKVCHCFSWRRNVKFLRSPQIALKFLMHTIPHITRSRGIIWIQGTFKPALTLVALMVFRLIARRTIFSPHNLFSRYGGRVEESIMNACLKLASVVVVYNDQDSTRLKSYGVSQARLPLMMHYPPIAPSTLEKWRVEVANLGAGVCAVGQIRADKNLPMLVHAASLASVPIILIGEDAGALEEVRSAIDSSAPNSSKVFDGFHPLEDLAAVIALTGAVALPYSVASQSGVAVLARAYGAKVIAYETGGLKEQADVLVPSLSTNDWEQALRKHANFNPRREIQVPKTYDPTEVDALNCLLKGLST